MDHLTRERLEAAILGLEISLECEEAVVAKLQPYVDDYLAKEPSEPATMSMIRRVRQCSDSKHLVKDLTQQIADLKSVLEVNRD